MATKLLHKAGAKLLFTPTLAGVRQAGVSYVVGRGSGRTTLELALRGLDGVVYIWHGTVGRHVGGTFSVVVRARLVRV